MDKRRLTLKDRVELEALYNKGKGSDRGSIAKCSKDVRGSWGFSHKRISRYRQRVNHKRKGRAG